MDREGVLVIGYGSDLRGDDGMGPEAARRLREHGFDTLAVHQLTPEIAERVAAAKTVIFLDADMTVTPGEISIRPIDTSAAGSQPVGHHGGPSELLRLASDAYGAHPKAWLIGMGGCCFALGEALSPPAQRAVCRAVLVAMQILVSAAGAASRGEIGILR